MSHVEDGPGTDEVPMAEDQARALTDQIKLGLEGVWELALTAYRARVWVALGYASWEEYCTREFGGCRLSLPTELTMRAELLAPLADGGMSRPAIAALVDRSVRTVGRAVGSLEQQPAPARLLMGLDGKQQPARKPTRREVLVRQANAGRLRRLGHSQREIADALGISQPTVSADLAEIDRIAASLDSDAPDLNSVLDAARDEAGRTDAAAVAERLGVHISPSRHLSRLVKQPARDLEATMRVVVNEVVMADEWLDPVERAAALEVLMPTTAQVLEHLRVIVAALPVCDRRGEQWQAVDAGIAELEHLRSQS